MPYLSSQWMEATLWHYSLLHAPFTMMVVNKNKKISLCTNVAFLSPKVPDYWHLWITHPRWKIGASGIRQHDLSQKVGASHYLLPRFFSSGFALDKHAVIRTSRLVVFHFGFYSDDPFHKPAKKQICHSNPQISFHFWFLSRFRCFQTCAALFYWFDIAVIAQIFCFPWN